MKTIEEQLAESEEKLKELLKGKNNNPRLNKLAKNAINDLNITKLIHDLEHEGDTNDN